MSKAKSMPNKVRRLKGAVLIMILAVMVVLIIMLAGAMSIASTAGNRAINKYEESQAYYSARSGLDLVTNILMTDAVHQDKGSSNDGNNSKSANPISETKPSQGLVLQEAIVGVLKTDGSGNPYYDTSKSLNSWDTITVNPLTGALVDNPSNDKKQKSYMKFSVSDMNTSPSGDRIGDGQSGLFSDLGDGNIEVKIQLLELVYDDGQTGIKRNNVTGNTALLTDGDEKSQYIMTCRIKVSCTATYLGNSSTVSVILSPYVNQKQASEGVVSTGSLKMSTNSNVLGGSSAATGFSWGNDGTTAGSVYVNGSTSLNAQKTYVLSSTDSICINGDFKIPNNMWIRSSSTGDVPFMFVNGTLNVSSNLTIGDRPTNNKVDLICKNIQFDNNPVKVYGNTYIDGWLRPNMSGAPLGAGNTWYDGNLFISDRAGVVADTGIYTDKFSLYDLSSNTNMSKNNGALQKTNLNVVSGYALSGSGFELQITMKDRSANKLLEDIILNGGDNFCTGDIYYYFEEVNEGATSMPHEYYGCLELEALRRMIVNLQTGGASYPNMVIPSDVASEYAANSTGFTRFLNKLHAVTPNGVNNDHYKMKYIIQPALKGFTPSFIDKMTFSPAGGGGAATTYSLTQIGDLANDVRPTYLLNISLPYASGGTVYRSEVDGTGDAKAKSVPTLLSKYADYYFLNDKNPDTGNRWITLSTVMDYAFLKLDASGNPQEITTFDYVDSLGNNGNGAMVTKNWRTELNSIATTVFSMKTSPTYNDATAGSSPADLVTRTWDILNALYKMEVNPQYNPNANSWDWNYNDVKDPFRPKSEKNVTFISPALQAKKENNINFTNYSSVGNATQDLNPGQLVQTYSPGELSNTTTTINTDSQEIVLILQPGSYSNGKLIISGANYCYIMMPANPAASESQRTYQFWNFSILSEGFSQDLDNGVSKFRVGSLGGAGYTKIKPPKIMYYVDDAAVINAYNGGKTTIMGYLYGPAAKLTSNTKCSVSKDISYEGTLVNNFSMDFVGSAFVGDVDVQNGYSFLYVPPVDDPDPGTPTINWRPAYYTNQDIMEYTP